MKTPSRGVRKSGPSCPRPCRPNRRRLSLVPALACTSRPCSPAGGWTPLPHGNGRIGRLLIALVLHQEGVVRQPLLYLSLYFKQHRAEYYRLLDVTRRDGDWEAWIDFFLEGVQITASGAVDTAHRPLALFRDDAERAQGLGRAAANALRVFDALRARPVATINDLAERSGVSYPIAARAVAALQKLDIVHEITGRSRDRVFAYRRYVEMLNEGGEPL